MMIQNRVNLKHIYIKTFKLFGINWKYDANLSVQKIFAYYNNKEEYEGVKNYIECIQKAHETLLFQYIFDGSKFHRMEEDPLKSEDAMHGLPPIWTLILNEITEEADR